MATPILQVLPGDVIPPSQIPTSTKRTLKLGPGLIHTPPSTIAATVAGILHSDPRKNALWVEHDGGRYIPHPQDLVVATVHHSASETYHVSITPHAQLALLPHLSFANASKKTRPHLNPGDIVYARVRSAPSLDTVELECVSAHTGKADGLGPLKNGNVIDVSLGFARRLVLGSAKGGCGVLEKIGEKVAFEVAVGRNGRVWVDAEKVVGVIRIGKILEDCDRFGEGLDEREEKMIVERIWRTG